MRNILYALVFLSGFTGVSYQVVWQKYLNIYLGGHSFSVALILSVFFLCLSAGYLTVGRYGKNYFQNPFWAYAILEVCIGVYAILSPLLFNFIFSVWPSFPVGSFMDVVSGLLFTTFFIGVPTFLMGGTIPMLVEGFSETEKDASLVHSRVYGINTFGAFLGALITGYYFIETCGLPLSLINLGALNIFLFLVIFVLRERYLNKYIFKRTAKNYIGEPQSKKRLIIYGISFLFGYITFSLEGLMIRLSSLLFGSTQYSYTIVISVFILAIATGSYLVNILKGINIDRAIQYQQILLGIFLILFLYLVPDFSYYSYRLKILIDPAEYNFVAIQTLQFCLVLVMLFFPVVLLGMNIPFLFSKLKQEMRDISPVVGTLYFWNSLGSFVGAIIGGYVVLMFFDDRISFKISISLVFVCLFLFHFTTQAKNKIAGFAPLIGLILVALVPNWKDRDLVPASFLIGKPSLDSSPRATFKEAKEGVDFLFSEYDPNTIVHILEDKKNKSRSVYVNAKPDAQSSGDDKVRAFNALMPLLLAQDTENIFVVGAGAGLSMSLFSDFPESKKIKVAEISKGVIHGLKFFDEFNNQMVQRGYPKIDIVNDDAYKVLRQEVDTYDIIACEPSNPWVNGVENLYTLDFLEMGKARLKPGGMYAQWFPVGSITPDVFLSVLNNFNSLYSWVSVFSESGNALLILASNSEPKFDFDKLNSRFQSLKPSFKKIKIDTLGQALLTELIPSPISKEISVDAMEHSLEFPSIGFRSVRGQLALKSLDISNVLDKNLFKRFDKSEIHYLYSQLDSSVLSKQDFMVAMKKFSIPSTKFHSDRLRFEIAEKFDSLKEVKISEKAFLRFKAVTGKAPANWERLLLSTKKPAELKKQWESLDDTMKREVGFANYGRIVERTQLMRLVQTLYSSNIPVDDKLVAGAFPDKCQDYFCVFQKLELLRISRKASKNMYSISLSKIQKNQILKSEIESLFNEVYF